MTINMTTLAGSERSTGPRGLGMPGLFWANKFRESPKFKIVNTNIFKEFFLRFIIAN